jgi:hypothetical protein
MSKEREIKCYFGILNLGGLMDMQDVFVSDVKKYS